MTTRTRARVPYMIFTLCTIVMFAFWLGLWARLVRHVTRGSCQCAALTGWHLSGLEAVSADGRYIATCQPRAHDSMDETGPVEVHELLQGHTTAEFLSSDDPIRGMLMSSSGRHLSCTRGALNGKHYSA